MRSRAGHRLWPPPAAPDHLQFHQRLPFCDCRAGQLPSRPTPLDRRHPPPLAAAAPPLSSARWAPAAASPTGRCRTCPTTSITLGERGGALHPCCSTAQGVRCCGCLSYCRLLLPGRARLPLPAAHPPSAGWRTLATPATATRCCRRSTSAGPSGGGCCCGAPAPSSTAAPAGLTCGHGIMRLVLCVCVYAGCP